MPAPNRTHTMTVRMTEEERAELDALATDARIAASDVVRQVIRALYVEKFGTRRVKLSPKREG